MCGGLVPGDYALPPTPKGVGFRAVSAMKSRLSTGRRRTTVKRRPVRQRHRSQPATRSRSAEESRQSRKSESGRHRSPISMRFRSRTGLTRRKPTRMLITASHRFCGTSIGSRRRPVHTSRRSSPESPCGCPSCSGTDLVNSQNWCKRQMQVTLSTGLSSTRFTTSRPGPGSE